MSTSLQLNALSRHFGGLKVLQDVNLEVPQGGIFGLIGPNGAGKTTIFNLITDLVGGLRVTVLEEEVRIIPVEAQETEQ